jgi:hypothetical protein
MRKLQIERFEAFQKRKTEENGRQQEVLLKQKQESIRQEKERIKRLIDRVTAQLSQSGGRFVVSKDGTVKDTRTGLTWCVLDSHLDLNRCFDYSAARDYVEKLKTGGHTDWRLPTVSELAGIYKSQPAFPGTGVEWYWSSETFVSGYKKQAAIVTTKAESRFKERYAELDKCGAVRAVRR